MLPARYTIRRMGKPLPVFYLTFLREKMKTMFRFIKRKLRPVHLLYGYVGLLALVSLIIKSCV